MTDNEIHPSTDLPSVLGVHIPLRSISSYNLLQNLINRNELARRLGYRRRRTGGRSHEGGVSHRSRPNRGRRGKFHKSVPTIHTFTSASLHQLTSYPNLHPAGDHEEDDALPALSSLFRYAHGRTSPSPPLPASLHPQPTLFVPPPLPLSSTKTLWGVATAFQSAIVETAQEVVQSVRDTDWTKDLSEFRDGVTREAGDDAAEVSEFLRDLGITEKGRSAMADAKRGTERVLGEVESRVPVIAEKLKGYVTVSFYLHRYPPLAHDNYMVYHIHGVGGTRGLDGTRVNEQT